MRRSPCSYGVTAVLRRRMSPPRLTTPLRSFVLTAAVATVRLVYLLAIGVLALGQGQLHQIRLTGQKAGARTYAGDPVLRPLVVSRHASHGQANLVPDVRRGVDPGDE